MRKTNLIISYIRRKILRIPKHVWNYQYSKGKWEGLKTNEMERFFVARDLLKKYAHHGRILEIGCGEGVFLQQIKDVEFSIFEGIDVSEVAIQNIANTANCVFYTADMETYIPANSPFQIIVFNEVLYYSKNAIDLLKRYKGYLATDGVFLIGLYDIPKSNEIWIGLNTLFTELESVKVEQDSKTWYYKIMK